MTMDKGIPDSVIFEEGFQPVIIPPQVDRYSNQSTPNLENQHKPSLSRAV